MVKIPKLAEDGQNWKIYCMKFLKVAATFDCLEVLAGRPYKGDDWDGCNALLCCTFMESVPPSIYFKIRHRTTHKNFKYLAKCFHDSEPIPCANKFQCTGTATAVETPEKSPMSANAATEQHADTKLDEQDLSTTKALTQGTEDVDDRNVGRMEDPCTSFEALAKGIGAEHSETTPVILTSAPHEMQNQPHSSLPLTPRPPIDGKPCECKQEVADNVVTAGRMNRTVKLAKPTKTDADVDRMALLGGELAEMACGVDEGNWTECEPQTRLQQTGFYCEESHQHSRNAMDNIPVAHGMPLEGWCASGEASDPKLDGIKSEGCASGMDERACIDEADGNAGCGIKPADSLNELTEFVALSIKLEDLGSGDIPCVHLGGMRMQMGDANGLGCRTDGSRGRTDTLTVHTDARSVETETETAANDMGNIRTHQIGQKTQNSPSGREITTPEPARLWRKVSVDNVDIYLPWNTPIVVLR